MKVKYYYYGQYPHKLRAARLKILRAGHLWGGLTVHQSVDGLSIHVLQYWL